MKNELHPMSTPAISVIMPVYNCEYFVREAIESILTQTFTNFEFIIINDGSSDNSEKIILSYKDERIKYYKNETNIQLIQTLNNGLNLANGKYIARMDADDISYPTRFEKQYSFLEKNSNFIICGSQIRYFGHEIKRKVEWIKNNDEDIKNQLFIGSCFAHPSVLIRKSIIDELNIRYNNQYKHAEDYKLWSDLAAYGNFYNFPEVLLKYRISSNQISAINLKEQKRNTNNIRKQNIDQFFKNLPIDVNYYSSEETNWIDIQNVIKIEETVIKNKRFYNLKIKKSFTAIILSHISNINHFEFKFMLFLVLKRIPFRKGFSFKEILRLIKRSYFTNN